MRRTIRSIVFALLAGVFALSAFAQASTATIRGKVTNERGSALGGAEINAVSTSSGFVHTVKAAADGTYLLAGLTPGEYNLVVAAPAYEARSETVTVRVGSESRTFKDGDGVTFPRNAGAKRTVTLDRVEFAGYGLDLPGHLDLRGRTVEGAARFLTAGERQL